ncbi:hypothetical protein Tco_0858724 [Tanacetum coccineum]|uniref:Reverse transcriptase domain-containing protein n=1 Tax=Tanacetum coccineum TaxID=301880 RepID=A0ABQ5BD92_9ASTR
MDREVKQLRRSRVPIVKVRWNSRRGPEFTWEREDQFRKKYPHLFTKTAPSSKALPPCIHQLDWYGYIKIHNKTVKNRQARTRERKSEHKTEEMVKLQSYSVKPAVKSIDAISSSPYDSRHLKSPLATLAATFISDPPRHHCHEPPPSSVSRSNTIPTPPSPLLRLSQLRTTTT